MFGLKYVIICWSQHTTVAQIFWISVLTIIIMIEIYYKAFTDYDTLVGHGQ